LDGVWEGPYKRRGRMVGGEKERDEGKGKEKRKRRR